MTTDETSRPPQTTQSGCPGTGPWVRKPGPQKLVSHPASSRVYDRPQFVQRMSWPLPCSSANSSGRIPERRWRLSVFWVMRNWSLPSRCSSTRERWDALGATWSRGTRHFGAGRPASRRVHTPSGPRKSGMPESVLMPAPVKAMTCSESTIQREISSICRWRRMIRSPPSRKRPEDRAVSLT